MEAAGLVGKLTGSSGRRPPLLLPPIGHGECGSPSCGSWLGSAGAASDASSGPAVQAWPHVASMQDTSTHEPRQRGFIARRATFAAPLRISSAGSDSLGSADVLCSHPDSVVTATIIPPAGYSPHAALLQPCSTGTASVAAARSRPASVQPTPAGSGWPSAESCTACPPSPGSASCAQPGNMNCAQGSPRSPPTATPPTRLQVSYASPLRPTSPPPLPLSPHSRAPCQPADHPASLGAVCATGALLAPVPPVPPDTCARSRSTARYATVTQAPSTQASGAVGTAVISGGAPEPSQQPQQLWPASDSCGGDAPWPQDHTSLPGSPAAGSAASGSPERKVRASFLQRALARWGLGDRGQSSAPTTTNHSPSRSYRSLTSTHPTVAPSRPTSRPSACLDVSTTAAPSRRRPLSLPPDPGFTHHVQAPGKERLSACTSPTPLHAPATAAMPARPPGGYPQPHAPSLPTIPSVRPADIELELDGLDLGTLLASAGSTDGSRACSNSGLSIGHRVRATTTRKSGTHALDLLSWGEVSSTEAEDLERRLLSPRPGRAPPPRHNSMLTIRNMTASRSSGCLTGASAAGQPSPRLVRGATQPLMDGPRDDGNDEEEELAGRVLSPRPGRAHPPAVRSVSGLGAVRPATISVAPAVAAPGGCGPASPRPPPPLPALQLLSAGDVSDAQAEELEGRLLSPRPVVPRGRRARVQVGGDVLGTWG